MENKKSVVEQYFKHHTPERDEKVFGGLKQVVQEAEKSRPQEKNYTPVPAAVTGVAFAALAYGHYTHLRTNPIILISRRGLGLLFASAAFGVLLAKTYNPFIKNTPLLANRDEFVRKAEI